MMNYKLRKAVDGDPVAHTTDTEATSLYRLSEEDEGVITDDGRDRKELIHRIRTEHQDGDMEDPDVMFEYKAYQDQSFFERSQKAKKIRQMQLEAWNRREGGGDQSKKLLDDGLAQSGSLRHRKLKKRKKTVMFEWNVLLMDAVLRNEIVEVDRLLVTYEDLERCPKVELVNCRSPDGLTPLHQCCIESLDSMAILLIKNGADLRAADSELWTPLHAAATCGHLSVVRILLEAAKVESIASNESLDLVREMLLAVNSDGNMPFDLCDNDQTLAYIEQEMQSRGITQDDIEAKRHKKEADMLRDLQLFIDGNVGRQPHSSGSMRRRRDGAKPEYRDVWDKFMTSSKTPNSLMMHVAAANGYLEVMDLLLKYRFPVDLEDADGWLPIHASVAWNQPAAAKKLVEAGADIMAKVRGTNETTLDLANVADLSEEVQKAEKFRDNLILWDAAYKAKCEEEAKNGRPQMGRYSSSESITSGPSASSPLLRRNSPKSLRVQRRSSLKDKEDLIALLQTLGDHDLKSGEHNQTTIQKFTRSPGGSLRDRNPTLPNVPEEAVAASAIVHFSGSPLDVDLINETISPELISSLLRTFEDQEDIDDTESVAEQLMRTAEDSLNQIDQPVTLSQLKHRRNRFRLLKRKEKPFSAREFLKEPVRIDEDDPVSGRSVSCIPVGVTTKSETVSTRQVELVHTNGGVVDSSELQKFKATMDELPVGSEVNSNLKLNDRFAGPKKRDKLYRVLRPGKDKTSGSDDGTKTWPRLPPSNGCCMIM